MRNYFLKNAATVFFAIAGLTSCQPSLNWRVVQLEGTNLKFELPCKPDKTTQSVKMAGLDIDLSMVGCEANDAVWAVMTAQVPATADRVEILKGWRTATLQNMRVTKPCGSLARHTSNQVSWHIGQGSARSRASRLVFTFRRRGGSFGACGGLSKPRPQNGRKR
jgi:hypothetical protein